MKSKMKINFFILITMLGLIFGYQTVLATEDIDVMHARSLLLQGALLLDVREPSEYAEVHAPTANLIPLGQLGSRLDEISAYKDKPIVVMCRSGRRSARAVELLKEAGFTQVSNIAGGINAWQSAGLKVVRQN